MKLKFETKLRYCRIKLNTEEVLCQHGAQGVIDLSNESKQANIYHYFLTGF